MRSVLVILALCSAFAITLPAEAYHKPTECSGSYRVTTVENGGDITYIDERYDGSVWIYQESNGYADYQPGGQDGLWGDLDPCGTEGVPPDTLLSHTGHGQCNTAGC